MLSEREICQDVLVDLKYLTLCGAVFAGEASPNIKHVFLDQLRSHQEMHTQFVRLMEQRGWYPRVPGDLGFQQSWSAPYAGTWQAPGGTGAWQQAGTPVGGGTWQAQGGWPGGSQTFQAIGQNLRESR